MSSCFGENIKISIFGQSHSPAIGVTIDGLPPGFRLDLDKLAVFMSRRAPGKSQLSSDRAEADEVEFLSGLAGGVTCGAPLCAIIRNTNVRPGDYSEFTDHPRPGHADYTAGVKYKGFQDTSGGGHFSGRLTAPLCIAGGICIQLLSESGVSIGAHIERIADVTDYHFNPYSVTTEDIANLVREPLTVIYGEAGEKMSELIVKAREDGDSVGGIIECAVIGLPAGLGDPMFAGMENRISSAIFAIPGIKGIEFGSGFECVKMRGSEHNDRFCFENGKIFTKTNNHGGVLGGITSGMPLIFRVAVKPTPSIAQTQKTISLSNKTEVELNIRGRHDPCIVPRAVPCIEAAAAIAIYDAFLSAKKYM